MTLGVLLSSYVPADAQTRSAQSSLMQQRLAPTRMPYGPDRLFVV